MLDAVDTYAFAVGQAQACDLYKYTGNVQLSTSAGTADCRLLGHPMSQFTERTPLLETRRRWSSTSPPRSKWCTIPYGLILLLFLLCNALAFVPKGWIPKSLVPDDFATVQLYVLLIADFLMDMLWPSLARVVEYAATAAIDRQDEPSIRRTTRKSESVNALLKAGLKTLPIFGTIRLAAEQLGSLFILLAPIYFIMTIGFTFVLVASARGLQAEKAQRDHTL